MKGIDQDKWIDELSVKNYQLRLEVEYLERKVAVLEKECGVKREKRK